MCRGNEGNKESEKWKENKRRQKKKKKKKKVNEIREMRNSVTSNRTVELKYLETKSALAEYILETITPLWQDSGLDPLLSFKSLGKIYP